MNKTIQETINNVEEVKRGAGWILSKVICESGNEYTTLQGDKWRGKIGHIEDIEYSEEVKHGKTRDFVNKRIVEEPVPRGAKVQRPIAPQGARDEFREAFSRLERKIDKIIAYLETPEGKMPPDIEL